MLQREYKGRWETGGLLLSQIIMLSSPYAELTKDLGAVNNRLILYQEAMRRLVLGLTDEKKKGAKKPPAKPSL